MNTILVYISKQSFRNVELLFNILHRRLPIFSCRYSTIIDAINVHTDDLVQKNVNAEHKYDLHKIDPRPTNKYTAEELNNIFLAYLLNNKDKQIKKLILDCCETKKLVNETILIKLFRAYSLVGHTDLVLLLQNYSKLNPKLCVSHGYFQHYLARAHCMKGNSEKGLSLLKDSYGSYPNLRNLCRCIFRELIQDSVLNRSEASLVIFKKYVIEFSDTWQDTYPLVCLWYVCWSSTWFSDQMLSNELLEASETLRNIVKEKATEFTVTKLQLQYNEDAVVRLLQSLLKYNMMEEYVNTLQLLFNSKLRNKDTRGCTEIIRNCQALGISLSSDQQGRYICMLINGEQKLKPKIQPFKLKF